MSRIAQPLTDLDANATLLSVDGIGAIEFDLISRSAMLHELWEVEGGGSVLPFVRQFYGVTHEIVQKEGG